MGDYIKKIKIGLTIFGLANIGWGGYNVHKAIKSDNEKEYIKHMKKAVCGLAGSFISYGGLLFYGDSKQNKLEKGLE